MYCRTAKGPRRLVNTAHNPNMYCGTHILIKYQPAILKHCSTCPEYRNVFRKYFLSRTNASLPEISFICTVITARSYLLETRSLNTQLWLPQYLTPTSNRSSLLRPEGNIVLNCVICATAPPTFSPNVLSCQPMAKTTPSPILFSILLHIHHALRKRRKSATYPVKQMRTYTA